MKRIPERLQELHLKLERVQLPARLPEGGRELLLVCARAFKLLRGVGHVGVRVLDLRVQRVRESAHSGALPPERATLVLQLLRLCLVCRT